MDPLGLLISIISSILRFIATYYPWGIAAIVLVLWVNFMIRIWPDRAVIAFIVRNVRVTKQRLAEVRDQLASIVGFEIHETQRAIAEQQLRLQAIRLEVIRLQQTVNVKSTSMLIGRKLQAIEKDYLRRMATLRSDQSREALRRVTEKEITALLESVDVVSDGLPKFQLTIPETGPQKGTD